MILHPGRHKPSRRHRIKLTRPLTSGMRYSSHACMLMADILNTRCKSLKLIYVDIQGGPKK